MVTCYSAIDTRLVVASINAEFKNILNEAKVNGYDYLEKFIQVSFCIPTLSAEKKAEFLERLFLSWYLRNPSGLFKALRNTRKKIIAYLRSHSEKFTGDYYGDFVVLKKSPIPDFSNAKRFDDKGVNLVGFLKNVKDDVQSSQTVKDIFVRKEERYLLNYSGSEKDNEEVLCLVTKYIQYFDNAFSTSMQKEQDSQIMPPATKIEQPRPNKVTNAEETGEVNIRQDSPLDLQPAEPHIIVEPQQKEEQQQQEGTANITVESFMQSMVDPDENVWFQRFSSKYLEGKPRAMTRIVNIYNVARSIAKVKLGVG